MLDLYPWALHTPVATADASVLGLWTRAAVPGRQCPAGLHGLPEAGAASAAVPARQAVLDVWPPARAVPAGRRLGRVPELQPEADALEDHMPHLRDHASPLAGRFATLRALRRGARQAGLRGLWR